jgi:lipid A 3-O-deacylase
MKSLAALLFLLLFRLPSAMAQAQPEQGDHELELWTGGGLSVNGGVGGISTWNVGLRYGWILTRLHGPGILRGRFEYAVDVVPVYWVFEPKGTAYGFAVDPFALKWDFRERSHFMPYLEMGSGALFTSRDVPPGVSSVNFASGGAAGLYFPVGKFHWSAELRFTHISDAGLTNPNPGINTVQVRLGLSVFKRREIEGR